MNLKAEITVDELLKAMKLCACVPECSWCAYYDPKKLHKDKCYERRNRDFEDYISNLQDTNEALINGQESLQKALASKEAKIEALQMDNAQLQSDNANANMNCEHLQAEIERLQGILLCFMDEVSKWENKHCLDVSELPLIPIKGESEKIIGQIKAEAIKEFAERLKTNVFEVDDINEDIFLAVEVSYIDYLVKEMVGDTE